jgi:hypothetical protein
VRLSNSGPRGSYRLNSKYPRAFAVQRSIGNQIVDGTAGLERRIELQQGFWPKCTGFEVRIDLGANPMIGDFDEATRIARVISNKPIS